MRLKRKGFTLLEVLIALMVLTGGVLVITKAFSAGFVTSSENENIDLALNIAQEKIEELQSQSYSTLQSTADSSSAHSTFSSYTVAVDIDELSDPIEINVTVSWIIKGSTDQVTLTTLKADV